MMGQALMAQGSITKLDSVIEGIRSYLSQQLGELESELDAARKEAAELGVQLASKQESIEVLVAGRDLLAAKLDELVGAVSETAAVPQARRSPEGAGEQSVQETVAQPELGAVVAVAVEPPATEPETGGAAETPPVAAKALNASQSNVLGFLESTPGPHKVAEIAAAVNGAGAGNAALQAVRRALGVLTEAGRAAKSTQSGTAFYSATAVSSKVSEEAEVSHDEDAEAPEPAAKTPRTSVSRKARSAKNALKKAAAKRTAKSGSAASAPTAGESSTPSRTRSAKKTASAPEEKTVRADRTKIVATLLGSPDPQSAAEVSRTVMGDQWRSSDATNFRNVLKSMVAEGVVAEHIGENNRSRYSVAASS